MLPGAPYVFSPPSFQAGVFYIISKFISWVTPKLNLKDPRW